jgi:hypothetical protein
MMFDNLFPWTEPILSTLLAHRFTVDDRLVFREVFSCFEALIEFLDVLNDDTVAVLFDVSVVDVVGCGLAVGEMNGHDFDEMLDLPQSGVVLRDVFDYGYVGALLGDEKERLGMSRKF